MNWELVFSCKIKSKVREFISRWSSVMKLSGTETFSLFLSNPSLVCGFHCQGSQGLLEILLVCLHHIQNSYCQLFLLLSFT